MKDVMVDLETLGTAPGSVILSIGAIAFDADHDELGEHFYTVIDAASSEKVGLTKDEATIQWWIKRSPEARIVLKQASSPNTSTPIVEALSQFNSYLCRITQKKDLKLWGNGSDFDNVLLIAAYKAVEILPYWAFYNHRCYRTLKNLCPHVPLQRTGTLHHALDDARTQAMHAIKCLQGLGE